MMARQEIGRRLVSRMGYQNLGQRIGTAKRTILVKETVSQTVTRVFQECDAIMGRSQNEKGRKFA